MSIFPHLFKDIVLLDRRSAEEIKLASALPRYHLKELPLNHESVILITKHSWYYSFKMTPLTSHVYPSFSPSPTHSHHFPNHPIPHPQLETTTDAWGRVKSLRAAAAATGEGATGALRVRSGSAVAVRR